MWEAGTAKHPVYEDESLPTKAHRPQAHLRTQSTSHVYLLYCICQALRRPHQSKEGMSTQMQLQHVK